MMMMRRRRRTIKKDARPRCLREMDKGDEQLTPEQNAVVPGLWRPPPVALFMYQLKSKGATQTFDRDTAVAMAAGAVHFCAYAVELRAFRTASSTVITPLLQLSGPDDSREGQPARGGADGLLSRYIDGRSHAY